MLHPLTAIPLYSIVQLIKNEDWDSTKPDLTDEIPAADQDYQYYFDGEKWWFRGYEKTRWKDLEKFLRENEII